MPLLHTSRIAGPLVLASLLLACSGSGGNASHDGGTPSGDGGNKSHTDGSSKNDAGATEGGTVACSDASVPDAGPDSIAPPLCLPAPTANITWGPNTTFLDEAQAVLVKSLGLVEDAGVPDGGDVDTTSQTIQLDSAGIKAAKLDVSAGRIIVIYGQAMRLITKSTDNGTTITLETAPTSLDQAATDAELDWSQAMELAPDSAITAGAMLDGKVVHRKGVVVTGNQLSFTLSEGGYKYGINMQLNGSSAQLDLTVTKSLGPGASAKFTATGVINRMVTSHHASVKHGKLQEYSTSTPGVQGKLTVGVVAAASASDALNFTLPFPLFKYVLLVGPIPVVETIGVQLVMSGQVPGGASVSVQADFDYDSDLGLTYDGTSFNATSNLGSPTINQTTMPHSASSGDVAFNGGVAFPAVSVSVFGAPIVASLQPSFLVGGTYTAFPACQTATTAFQASASYSIGILGLDIASGSTVLFRKETTLLASPTGCAGDAGM